MSKRILSLRYLLALVASCLGVSMLRGQSGPAGGVPIRVWVNGTSGTAVTTQTQTQIIDAISFSTYQGEFVWRPLYGTGAVYPYVYAGWTQSSGGALTYYYWVLHQTLTSSQYITGSMTISGTFLPSSPFANDGAVSGSFSTNSPNQNFSTQLGSAGFVRAEPGKSYKLSASFTNLSAGKVSVSAPPGYKVILNGQPRNSVGLTSNVVITLLPRNEGPHAAAGFASSISPTKVDWQVSLGSLRNGDSAGSLRLVDTAAGSETEFAQLFTPNALSYEATSDEVFVYRENNVIRQIIANQVAVDIVAASNGLSYEIKCYNPSQIQSYVPCSFSGEPFVTYRVEKGTSATSLKFTRETRNILSPTATGAPVARRDVMALTRAGVWPNLQWTKDDWTLDGQPPLARTIVNPELRIFTQPTAQLVAAGASVTLTAAASGYPAPTYQWKKGATVLAGETNATLTLGNVQAGNAGDYSVVATNSRGSVTSAAASIGLYTVPSGSYAPIITTQPTGVAGWVGTTATLNVVAIGSPAPTYQWKKGGTSISGATGPTLTLASLQPTDAADYTVTVSNTVSSVAQSVTSTAATVTVASTRAEAISVLSAGGAVALNLARNYSMLASGEAVTSETLGTGTGLTGSYDYFTDVLQPGSFGYTKSVSQPGGGWEAYDYYDTSLPQSYQGGKVKFRYRPYGNLPATATRDVQKGEVTYYEYSADPFGFLTRPALVQTFVNYVSTAKTTFLYSTATTNNVSILTTRKRDFVDTANYLETITRSYPEDTADAFLRNKATSVQKPDGVKQSFVYQRGTWNGTTFTPGSAPNTASRIVSIVGSALSSAGPQITTYGGATIDLLYLIEGKSRAEVTIRDERALPVRTESYAWVNSTWQLIGYTDSIFNFAGLLVQRTGSNGALATAVIDGELKTSETDESGVTTSFQHDAAGRVGYSTRAASGDIPALTTQFTYDAMGRTVKQLVGWGLTGPGDNTPLITSKAYDDAGRVVSETQPGQDPTTHSYDVAMRTHTVTKPDGGALVETTNRDGRPASRTGTGTVAEYYTYGVKPDGRSFAQTNIGAANSARWVSQWRDLLSRETITVRPAFGSTATTFDENFSSTLITLESKFYADTAGTTATGKLVKSTKTGLSASTRYEYDALGQVFRTGLDLTDNGLVPNSMDRITETVQSIERLNNAWWARSETKAYAEDNSATTITTGIKRQRLTGHTAGLLDEAQTVDAEGNLTTQITTVSRTTATATVSTTTTGILRPQVETKVAGFTTKVVSADGLTTTTTYDKLLRRSTVTNSRNVTSRVAYVPGTALVQAEYQPITTSSGTTVETAMATYVYDTSARPKEKIDAAADASTPQRHTYTTYDLRGQVLRQWGDATYPVEYGYNALGERTTLRTFRSTTTDYAAATWGTATAYPSTEGDLTTWAFEPATGLLLSKKDADNKLVTYAYTRAGQMEKRTWARGTITKYAYDPVTAEQTGISYFLSDGTTAEGTPALTYTYNRLGKAKTIGDYTGTRTFGYGTTKPWRLVTETLGTASPASFYGGRVFTHIFDESLIAGRVRGFQLGTAAVPHSELEETFAYTEDGRFDRLTASRNTNTISRTFRYGYEPNSALIKTLNVDVGTHNFTVSRTFDANRDLLTSADSLWDSASRTRFDYTYNALGYRVTAVQKGSAFNDYVDTGNPTGATTQKFGYDGRGQLTSAVTNLGATVDANTKLPDRQHEYAYDPIGNRTSANRTGQSEFAEKYTANALNQYVTTGTNAPGRENQAVTVSGTGDPASRVVVAGAIKAGETGGITPVKAEWKGNYWSANVRVPNSAAPWRGPLLLYAGKTAGGETARVESRMTQIPAKAQDFTYDLDGNLTGDGVWTYTWDAENRLVRMTTAAAPGTGYAQRAVEFRYDYLGRRVQKAVYDVTTLTSPVHLSGRRYLYDGWNLIAEYIDTGGVPWSGSPGALARSYVWGLDIARSLVDAGGVGALLQTNDHASGKSYFPTYDGNGNVISLLDTQTGAVAAAYEYSPYGEQIRAQHPDAAMTDQPFRFSTKFTDSETGLVYYGRRYYDPKQGRFLGRDPKKEKGGLNLYAFCGNNGVNRWDYLGMDPSGPANVGGSHTELEWRGDYLYQLTWHVKGNGNEGDEPRWDVDPDAEEVVAQRLSDGTVVYGDGGFSASGSSTRGMPQPGDPGYSNGGSGSPLPGFTMSFASRLIIGVSEPVHQWAIDKALPGVADSLRRILKEAVEFADLPQFQTAENSFRHAMRDGRVRADGTQQTVEEARSLANSFVRERILNAQFFWQGGIGRPTDYKAAAMRELGLAIHTLQDSTSPSHRGFQPWGGPSAQSKTGHFFNENFYPSDDSDLIYMTQLAWRVFEGSVPLPDNFFDLGP